MPTRPSKVTRNKIMKAAAHIFAEDGYAGASIRKIVARADVNQAAISYHFGSKEGLYRAVLQMALQALLQDNGTMAPAPGKLAREAALRTFIRRQLRPMLARDELSQYLRILNWETVRPTPAFRKFMAEEAGPYLASAATLVRRFLPPEATEKQAVLGALWLFGQCSIFVRNCEQLARPPLGFRVDRKFVDGLGDTIASWAAGGLPARMT
jgi:TetR/AcrR family transcriptional regulator, regulator of cefoperazone and chloramphenicol sensitivity